MGKEATRFPRELQVSSTAILLELNGVVNAISTQIVKIPFLKHWRVADP
jgi:hypothetical protein